MDLSNVPSLISPVVSEFLSRRHKHYIGGEWVDSVSGKTTTVEDPATGLTLATVAEGDAADVDLAVAAARKAFESGPWPSMNPIERGKLITRLAMRIEELADELAEIEAIDGGKPLAFARHGDMTQVYATYHYMAGWASKLNGEQIQVTSGGDVLAYTLRQPVGVAGLILPWNFPQVLLSYKLAPALATGCTVVIKPAEQTPLSSIRLAEIIEEVGFPPGVVNIVTGFGDTAGAAIAAHPDVDKIAFTGSTEVGKIVARAATGTMKRLTLELGGKSPVIVFPDADMEKTIPGIAGAGFYHQGQVCTAGTRIYAHKSVHDRLLEGLAEQGAAWKAGHPLQPGTTLGPLISDEQLQRVSHYIDEGRKSGASVVSGGKRIGNAGYFVEPTILANTDHTMSVVREEIFGPVICAMSFDDDDLDQIARSANDTPYGLAASIWTSNLSVAHKMANRIKAGNVWINSHSAFDSALPFGGAKQSGLGRECGFEAIRAYTELKSVSAAL
ncbi:aldehyde dehydrogenase family protein [Microbaculum sp. FT89]|uniref:aldehyde dehydrogenase family protein n=1 Tax=Microbaculum sp. FT89 TaxID=3447298 RepID=UPI003F5398FC